MINIHFTRNLFCPGKVALSVVTDAFARDFDNDSSSMYMSCILLSHTRQAAQSRNYTFTSHYSQAFRARR